MEDKDYRKLMDYAMRALGRRAHTEFEMREKIKKRPVCNKELEDRLIERLIELNLINDEDFIRRSISDAINTTFYGRLRLMKKLRSKGISIKEFDRIWSSMEIDEREIAKNALKKANKRFANLDGEKLFMKKARFLTSRGFPAEIVFELAKSRN